MTLAPSSTPSIRRRAAKRALLAALLVGLVCALNFFVLRPAQERGVLDNATVLPNVIVTLLALPGLLVSRNLFVTQHHIPLAAFGPYFAVATAVSAAFYGLLAFVWAARRAVTPPAPGAGRRAFLRRAASLTVGGGVGLLGGYTVLLEPRWPRVRRLALPLRDLPASLVGLRVVQLTDVHLGHFNAASYVRGIVERCNALAPDLVLMTGDYVHGSSGFAPRAAALLAGLRSRLGIVGVLGNHDHWVGAELSRGSLLRAGVRLVDNSRVWVTRAGLSSRPVGGALCVAGVGDLWEDATDLDAALGGVAPEVPRILLSHNPDFAETDRARDSTQRVDLMLAGHTHGGQVRLPLVGALISPSEYGRKYDQGFVRGPRFWVFVSAGVGTTILPVRFRVRPEIVLFELRAAGAARAGA